MIFECVVEPNDFLEIVYFKTKNFGNKQLKFNSIYLGLNNGDIHLDKEKAIELRDELTRLIKEME